MSKKKKKIKKSYSHSFTSRETSQKSRLFFISTKIHVTFTHTFVKQESKRLIREKIDSYKKIVDMYNGDWYLISKHQYLTEDFMIYYSSCLYWSFITQYQKLSPDFIRRFQSKLDSKYLSI
jgi:hypothetical protein